MNVHLESSATDSHGLVIWLTGLPGAGKTTIANALQRKLVNSGGFCFILDSDELRAGLSSDLGFSTNDRRENIRRIANVARWAASHGHPVVVAAITPSHDMRLIARSIVGETFREVFVDTPLSICETRDPKGLYQKARSGSLKTFTGVSDLYERPDAPDLVLRTDILSIAEETVLLLNLLGIEQDVDSKTTD
jgi:adenylyl-sulfate kinase